MLFKTPQGDMADAVTLQVDVRVRSWDQADVNGVEERRDAPTIPFSDGERWRIDIDLATGTVAGWPAGVTASTSYKVNDSGVYRLLDADRVFLAQISGYAPGFLASDAGSGGDFVELEIGPDGKIAGWAPDLACFDDWESSFSP